MYGMDSMVKSQIKRVAFTNNGKKFELYIDWSIKDNLILALDDEYNLKYPEDDEDPVWFEELQIKYPNRK